MNVMSKLLSLFRINFKVLFLLVCLLILLDQWVVLAFKNQITGDAVYRLASEDKNTISEYLNLIKKDQGHRVLFIGDSVMYGSAVESDHDTIPAYVAKIAQEKWPTQPIHYYNLGFKGLSIGDTYYLLKKLKEENHPFDLIIYDANIGWFTDKLINREVILELYQKNEVDWASLDLPTPERDLSDFINDHIMKYWKFYHFRYQINEWLFGKPPTRKIREEVNHFFYDITTEDQKLLLPWYEKNWDQKFKGDWKLGKLPYHTKQWEYFDQLVKEISTMSKHSLLFMIPRNKELLEKYNRIDYSAMDQAKQAIQKVTNQYQVGLLDYGQLLDSKLFSDTVHPLSEGNHIVAEQLVSEMEKIGIFTE